MAHARNALQDFPSEDDVVMIGSASTEPATKTIATAGVRKTVIGLTVASAIVATLVAAAPGWIRPSAPAVPSGKLTIDSTPAGIETVIDGSVAGLTPLSVTVKAGAHTIALRRGAEVRELPVTISANGEVTHHIEFPPSVVAPATGTLSVTSEPAGAQVTLDGKVRGLSPIALADVTPGDHLVTVSSDSGTAARRVVVESGANAAVVFSLAKSAGPSAGWLTVTAPFGVQVFEGNDLVGAEGVAKIMVTAGRHEFRFVNEAIGFEESRRIDVIAGKTATFKIDAPKASVSANARPWADVIVDGASVGQTPIANLALTVGSHQIVFRHPQFGEQRQTFVVSLKGPNRVTADMTKK